jgi:penicillin-insensitive murein endopeptidase
MAMRTRRLAAVSCCIAALGSATASSAIAAAAGPRPGESPALAARSVGSPTDGSLVGGVPLREGAELRLRWPEGPRWALPALVTMLERAARTVERRFPGSILLVGDLSSRQGGSLSGHVSHESGRDADVGFYYADAGGRSVRTPKLLPVRPSGTVSSAGNLRFDEARNWALVEALLTDSGVMVQRIFVAAPLKQRLLEYARRHGTRPDVVGRADSAMRQPVHGRPHDDHFHVRIACPREQHDVCVPEPGAVERASRERTAALDPPGR